LNLNYSTGQLSDLLIKIFQEDKPCSQEVVGMLAGCFDKLSVSQLFQKVVVKLRSVKLQSKAYHGTRQCRKVPGEMWFNVALIECKPKVRLSG